MMKAKMVLVSIIGAISLVFFSLSSISTYIEHASLGNMKDTINQDQSMTFLSVMNIDLDEEKSFLSILVDWAVANEVTIVRDEFDQRTNTRKIYVAGTADYYNRLLIKTKLSHQELRNIELSTKAHNNTLIRGLGQDFLILPMRIHSSEIMVNNLYFINTEIANTSTLQTLLESTFPTSSISFSKQNINAYQAPNVLANGGAISIFLSINILLFVFINNHLLANSKKIAVLKSEGHSLVHLWGRFSIIYFCGSHGLSVFFSLLFSQFFISIHTLNAGVYFGLLFEYSLVFVLLSLIFSWITLLLLRLIDPINSIKGYSNLGYYLKYLNFSKLFILAVSLFYLVPNVNYLYQNFRALMQETSKLESFQSVYVIDAIFAKYGDYHGREVFGQEQGVISDLQKDHQLFSFYQFTDYQQSSNIYMVDKQYLLNQNLWLPKYEDQSIVFMKDLKRSFHLPYDEIVQYDVDQLVNLDERLTNINGLYMSDDRLAEDAILYFKGEETLTPLNHLFYYEGSLLDAQNFIDALMIKHGFEPCYLVNSYAEIYAQNKQSFILDGLLELIIGLSLLAVYIHLSFTYYRSYLSANNQKIKSMWSEGHSKIKIFKAAISINLGFLVGLLTLVLIFMNTDKMVILGSVSVLFVLEVLVLFKFVKGLLYSDIRRFS